MPRQYCALEQEFYQFLDERGYWPPFELYRAHMKERHNGIANKALTDLVKGAAVQEKASRGVLTFALESRYRLEGSRRAVMSYMEAKGVPSPEHADLDTLLDVIRGPLLDRYAPPVDDEDMLETGALGFPRILGKLRGFLDNRSRACQPEDIDPAIGWIHILIACHAAPRRDWHAFSAASTRASSEAHMGIRADEYALQMRAWSQAVPQSVRIVLGRRHPIGVTVVLPLTDDAYERIRTGQIASYECTVEDLQVPSRNLLLEVAAERLGAETVEPINPTPYMLASMLSQIAHLTDIRSQPEDTLIRMVSFEGTRKSASRLKLQGFKPTGAVMPRSGVKILERTFSKGARVNLEAVTVMTLEWIQARVTLD
ncbi:MAG: hypothetical protein KDA28_01200 [Phycisphaerales bacterium]|nr:hypothetical protein [Phycisphaerales bacterium]